MTNIKQRLVCSVCHTEGDEVDELPIGSYMCRNCSADKSALDGKTREEIIADPMLRRIQWDRNGAAKEFVGGLTLNNAEYFMNWRPEGRRIASRKYRRSERGKRRRAELSLEKNGVFFTLDEWEEHVNIVYSSSCAECREPFRQGHHKFRVLVVPASREIKDHVPLCQACKNKHAAKVRWLS
jgi:hypothetical protein